MPGKIDKYIFQIGLFYFFRFLKTGSYEFIDQLIGRIQCDDIPAVNDRYPVTQNFRFSIGTRF